MGAEPSSLCCQRFCEDPDKRVLVIVEPKYAPAPVASRLNLATPRFSVIPDSSANAGRSASAASAHGSTMSPRFYTARPDPAPCTATKSPRGRKDMFIPTMSPRPTDSPEPSPRQAAALQALVQTDIIVGYLASTYYEQKRFEEQLNGRQKQAFFQAVFRHRQKLNPHSFELELAHWEEGALKHVM